MHASLAVSSAAPSSPFARPMNEARPTVALPPESAIDRDVRRALDEDIGSGDVTAALLADAPAHGYILAKEAAVIAGGPWFEACFRALDPQVRIDWRVAEGDRVEQMSVMRKKIAEHMVQSRRTSAHVTTVYDIDMTRIAKLREQQKDSFAERTGTKLSFMPFIFQAVNNALRKFPIFNAQVSGDQIIYKRDINLGMAVALDWGLINRVVADDELESSSSALLERLANGPTRSYAGAKRLLNLRIYADLDGQLEAEAEAQRGQGGSADFIEGVMAFAEKREPKFTGS